MGGRMVPALTDSDVSEGRPSFGILLTDCQRDRQNNGQTAGIDMSLLVALSLRETKSYKRG